MGTVVHQIISHLLEHWLGEAYVPLILVLGLAMITVPTLERARQRARGTAWGGAVTWGWAATGLGLAALGEPIVTGRPTSGYATYLSTMATLAALISVLNARNPGGGAWAILMALLVLVFLIPWLEGPGLARHARGFARLRLNPPWSIFYWLLVVAGVTNYLPTRYGPSAACLAIGFLLEYLGLTRPDWPPARRELIWTVVPGTFAAAVWVAGNRSGRAEGARPGLDAAWTWFRDHWGVVWALRVRDRFNQSAEAQDWPIRLGWYGVIPESADVPDAALATFKSLLRRFAEPERIDEVLDGTLPGPCQPPGGGG